MPERIQRKRARGWKLPDGAVCVDRSTRFGNPFTEADAREEGYDDPRGTCVDLYAGWLQGDGPDVYVVRGRRFDRCWVWDHMPRLVGKDLACWCPLPAEGEPDICHGAVLLAATRQLSAIRERRRSAAGAYAPAEPRSWWSTKDVAVVGGLL